MTTGTRYLYWLTKEDFVWAKSLLQDAGYHVTPALLTPCQVLKASDNQVVYASPEVWSRMCSRQSTWYQSSQRAGHYMMMSTYPLPEAMKPFLDAELAPTDFQPEGLASLEAMQAIVDSDEYQDGAPEGWEDISWRDAVMFKFLFGITRFWGRGDNLKKHWIGHRANHGNFLARHFTTQHDGEEVAYSVTNNDGVCSSCAEFFNVVAPSERKLVRACPGSVIFGGAERDVFLDVKPIHPVQIEV